MIGSDKGVVNRVAGGDIPVQSRTAKGVAVMKIGRDDMFKSCAVLNREDILIARSR